MPITETFGTTETVNLESWTGDGISYEKNTVIGVGTYTLDGAGRLYCSSGTAQYHSTEVLTGADQTILFGIYMLSDVGAYTGANLRADVNADTGYRLLYAAATNRFELYKVLAGAYTLLGVSGGTIELSADTLYEIEFSAIGTTLTAKMDGVTIITQTDSSISSPGSYALFLSEATSTTGYHITGYTFTGEIAASETEVAVNNANWFFSPCNWYINGAVSAISCHLSAYFKIGFTGTSAVLNVDVASLVAASVSAGDYPVVSWAIDGGVITRLQLTSATTTITLASGLAAGNHQVFFYIAAMTDSYDRWNTPAYGVKITGMTLAEGAAAIAPVLKTKRIIIYGDSISEGWYAISGSAIAGTDSLRAYPLLLMDALDAEIGVLGWSAQSFTNTGMGNVPAMWVSGNDAATAWNKHFAGQSLLTSGSFPVTLDEIWCMHGRNDEYYNATDAAVQEVIQALAPAWRTAAGANTIIRFFIPFSGYRRSIITSTVASLTAVDSKVVLVDLGPSMEVGLKGMSSNNFSVPAVESQTSSDSIHPGPLGHAKAAAMIAAAVSEGQTIAAIVNNFGF